MEEDFEDSPVTPESIWIIAHTARYLTAASTCILAGALLLVSFPPAQLNAFTGYSLFATVFAISGVGVLLHLLAWVGLWEAVARVPGGVIPYYGSVVGLVLGIAVLPFATSGLDVGQFASDLLWKGFIVRVPYHPLVYAPGVIAHAFMFFTFVPHLRGPGTARLVTGGAVALGLTGLAGLALFFFTGFSNVVTLLAGVTVVGYGLIMLGLRKEYAGLLRPVEYFQQPHPRKP